MWFRGRGIIIEADVFLRFERFKENSRRCDVGLLLRINCMWEGFCEVKAILYDKNVVGWENSWGFRKLNKKPLALFK